MARIRTVKPTFWTDGVIVKLTPWARLFYIGCWNFALCDRGHLPDDPDGLKLQILPADPVDASELVEELIRHGRLVRRATSDGRSYLCAPRLAEHQKTDGRWTPRCPFCAAEATPNHAETPRTTPNHAEPHRSKGRERKGRESKGEEPKTTGSQSSPDEFPADRPPGSRQLGTRLPDGFEPTAQMIAWARENAPLARRTDHEMFVDHWRAQTGQRAVKRDWEATWRNWMRRVQDNRSSRGGHQPGQRRQSTGEQRIDDIKAGLDELNAADARRRQQSSIFPLAIEGQAS